MLKTALLLSLFFVGINCQSCGPSSTYQNYVVSVGYMPSTSTSTTYQFQLIFNNTNSVLNQVSKLVMDVHAFPLEYMNYFTPTHFDLGNINGGAFFAGILSVPVTSETTNAISGSGTCVSWGFFFKSSQSGQSVYFAADLKFSSSNVAPSKRDVEVVEEEVSHDVASRGTCGMTTAYGGGFQGYVGQNTWNVITLAVPSNTLTYMSVNAVEIVGSLTTTYSGTHAWTGSFPMNTQKSVSVSWDCQAVATYSINITSSYKCNGVTTTNSITTSLYCMNAPGRRSLAVQEVPITSTLRLDYSVGIASAGVAVGAVALIAAVVIIRRRKVEQSV